MLSFALLVAGASAAGAHELRVGRTIMQTSAGVQVDSVELSTKVVPGDGDLRAERRMARLDSPGQTWPAYLLVENIDTGGGRFEWHESCAHVKPSARVFVYSPFHTNRDECVVVQGPFDLTAALEQLDSQAYALATARGWKLGSQGYIVVATFAIESGSMLSVTALVPTPFSGLASHDIGPSTAQASGVPPSAIAWGLALGKEVQSGVLSLSRKWQLPPI
ncbi:MAG: hypothetical protein KF891_14155 [Rhizobacter sp.]|nr:hypothetical protein [Rhizobacter sp.]